MTDYIVLDNMIWVQRLIGDQLGSKVVDIIKKECDTVILSEEITDAYAKTLEMHHLSIPRYMSTLLVTELEVMQKVVRPNGPEPEPGGCAPQGPIPAEGGTPVSRNNYHA